MGMKKIYNLSGIILAKFFVIIIVLSGLLFFSRSVNSQTVKIGAVLPLFENSDDANKKQLGTDILNGIKFAISQYKGSPKIKLEVRDNKRDIPATVTLITDLCETDSVSCIIGPVYSSELSEVGAIAMVDEVPIVSPTATGDDLAETHPYVFQLNPSYKVRGKLMADYLIKELRMKNFVVISEDTYGINFRDPFESEVRDKKGKILLSSAYSKDAKNINEITADILKLIKDNDLFINIGNLNAIQRKKIEDFGIRYSLIDSLAAMKPEVSIYYLFGKNGKKVADTMNIKPYALKDVNNTKFIQGYIDAIYIPISNANEISMIVPELYSSQLSFFIAGTGDWNNEQVLQDNKVYLKNLAFESEYYLDEESSDLIDLKADLKKTKYKLNKSFLFGYDAMNLIAGIIADGNITAKDINSTLNKVSSYSAIKSKISLDFNRVNSELNILTYDEGMKKITSYKVSK
jgi:ABC-type branched-subunit amino acid transport system substrate-binding protein